MSTSIQSHLQVEVDEQSVVQTRFATSVLALLRASLGEDIPAVIDPLAELVRVRRPCLLKSRQQGPDPDNRRNLTRSVILETPVGQA